LIKSLVEWFKKSKSLKVIFCRNSIYFSTFNWCCKAFSRKTLFFNFISAFKILVKSLSLSPLSLPALAHLSGQAHLSAPAYWSNPTSGSVGPTGRLLPRSLASSSLSCSPWRLRRLAAAALNSDELRRCPPLRWCSIDRSSDSGSACPQDLLDCLLVACIPFASEARDLGHGDLELALELLGLVHGEIWAWWAGCFVDVSSATSPGSMLSWPRGHCLAMPRWYLLGVV
jgi:hypothetical protein